MKTEKMRLDVLLYTRGLFPSREAARRAIMAGLVRFDGTVMDKPGTQVKQDQEFAVAVPEHQYVSRGGKKLERALLSFSFDLGDKIVVDVGASTGGFTDCALQNGAASVYAVDVGYGQLAWKLRNDPRVTVMERTNFRHVDLDRFDPKPQVAVMDVSFISTKLLIPQLHDLLGAQGDILSLIKPQFEAGRAHVGKGGVVRDPDVHRQVLRDMLTFVYDLGCSCMGLDYSPITGGDGNIEFLARWHCLSDKESLPFWHEQVDEVVQQAWGALNR